MTGPWWPSGQCSCLYPKGAGFESSWRQLVGKNIAAGALAIAFIYSYNFSVLRGRKYNPF